VNLAEEEPLGELILEILRRRKRARLKDILDELYPLLPEEERYSPEIVRRVRRLLDRLETTLSTLRVQEPIVGAVYENVWYYARPVRELVTRFPGRRFTKRDLSIRLGIPLEEVDRLLEIASRYGWIFRVTPEEWQISGKIYRVQKMRAYRTDKKPQLYQVKHRERIQVPRQLVLENFAPGEETDRLVISTFGAVRLVVYTANPERWTEERLERIMRGLFAQEGITFTYAEDKPYVDVTQAFEKKEVELTEKPPELELEEVDVWLWVSKKDGFTYAYNYTRRLGRWEYTRYRVT
jgi:hypothetical protein